VLVHALVAAVGTGPEPTILAVLDSLDEELAHLVGRRLWVSVLGLDDIAQLLLVPVCHVVLLSLLILLLLLQLSRVGVQTLLLSLDALRQVVTELALSALVTSTLFEELTEHRLGVDTEGNLLDLNGLEEFGGLSLCGFGGELFLFAGNLLGFLSLFVRVE